MEERVKDEVLIWRKMERLDQTEHVEYEWMDGWRYNEQVTDGERERCLDVWTGEQTDG